MKEELSRKLDNVLEKAGLSSRYQIIMVLLFIFQFTINEYFDIAVPYLDDLPYVFTFSNREIWYKYLKDVILIYYYSIILIIGISIVNQMKSIQSYMII